MGWDIGAYQSGGRDIGAFQGTVVVVLDEQLLIFGSREEDDPPPPGPDVETEILLVFMEEELVTADLVGLVFSRQVISAVLSDVGEPESLVGSLSQPQRLLAGTVDLALRASMEQRQTPKAVVGGFDGRYPLTRPARGVAVCGGARRGAAQVNA